MKNISICLLVLFFITISCKNNTGIKKTTSTFAESDSYKSIAAIQGKMICNEVLKKIIKSNNLDFKNNIRGFVKIDKIKDNFIMDQVYLKNNIGGNPEKLQIVENTIAWLSFNLIKVKLNNATVNSENPIELNFDKNIVKESKTFNSYKIIKNHKSVSGKSLKFSIVSEISNKEYGKNIHQSNTLESNNYLKYFFKAGDTLPLGSGKNFNANNYLYLQKVNNNRSKIASNTKADAERYSVIVIRDNKIISTLEIDLKNGEFLNQLEVKKDDIISLRRKDISNNSTKWKSYRITSNGKMVELQ